MWRVPIIFAVCSPNTVPLRTCAPARRRRQFSFTKWIMRLRTPNQRSARETLGCVRSEPRNDLVRSERVSGKTRIACSALQLPPLSLNREGGPIVRRLPLLLTPHLDLCGAKRGGRALPILQHLLVETRHQLRRRLVAHVPQAHHDTRGAGVHEPSRKPDQPFTSDLFPETGLTRAQHNEFGRKSEVEDLVGAEEPILGI